MQATKIYPLLEANTNPEYICLVILLKNISNNILLTHFVKIYFITNINMDFVEMMIIITIIIIIIIITRWL